MPSVKKIRVLVVDDSILFRTTLQTRLGRDNYIEIVGTAGDAMDAMAKIETLHPDVVTLDVEMPRMNGIDFLKTLMPKHPLPVVVVSSLPITTLDALSAGAVDFVKKPTAQTSADIDAFIRELSIKIKIASTARVASAKPVAVAPSMPKTTLLKRASADTLIAIGASTGGTEAIIAVLRNLPPQTPGIVIVQHMPPVFTKMYAERIDKICAMSVKEAENGDRVQTGQVLIAPGGFQMRLARDGKGYYVKIGEGDKVNGHCPSVDVLFDSVAEFAKGKALGVILTGMGGDGARGLLAMRKSGSYTIGQDQESCVVYGMPMVAQNIGAVTQQLPLTQIGPELVRSLNAMPG